MKHIVYQRFTKTGSPLLKTSCLLLPALCRLFSLLILLLGALSLTHAQDITPSTEAQGYLKEKHGTVDHSTGIFHYSVPLFTLSSSGFSLPVSLGYTSGGVRFDSRSGLIGHGWSFHP